MKPNLIAHIGLIHLCRSTANAEVMPAYIFAILKRQKPIEEIRGFAMQQMKSFLESSTFESSLSKCPRAQLWPSFRRRNNFSCRFPLDFSSPNFSHTSR
jgi:hypothetical protein